MFYSHLKARGGGVKKGQPPPPLPPDMERGGEAAVEKGAQNKNTGRRNRTEPVELEHNNELWVAVSLRTQPDCLDSGCSRERRNGGRKREKREFSSTEPD